MGSKFVLILQIRFRLLPANLLLMGGLLLQSTFLFGQPEDYPEWLEKVPGQPTEPDPDDDGVPTFLEYALGAEPGAAVDPFESGSSPVFRRENNITMVLLPFPGKRDMIYLLEGKSSLKDAEWTTLARKLGNAPWQSVTDGFEIVETSEEVTLYFENWPDATFLRLRVESGDNTLQRKALAARFLKQATFGPTMGQIEALADDDLDFEGWIDAQLALPASSHLDQYYSMGVANPLEPRRFGNDPRGNSTTLKVTVWYDIALLEEDQLRQRMAWALSQIFVLGEAGSLQNFHPVQWVNWYDILVNNAFGNYRELLTDVTYSPKMGDYLTYLNNRKANGNQLPDENYAREVMQLFTVGLWHLNNDGTLKLDGQGQPIPTYTNYHITELAKVFTGLTLSENVPGKHHIFPNGYRNNRVDPMVARNFQHDTSRKVMLDGTMIPSGGNVHADIAKALDVLFNHPNTPPFVAYRLIQRFTSSNPSPEYIERVANVFIDNGEGERGDLAAIIKAILLDPEARDAGYAVENSRGKLREPLLKFTQLCRAFHLRHNPENQHFYIESMAEEFGMSPYQYPDVFNFYQPDFTPFGKVRDAGLVAPEFQILNDSTGLKTFTVFHRLINYGLVNGVAKGFNPRPKLDFSEVLPFAEDIPALIDYLDLLLTHQTLRDDTKELIADAVEAVPSFFSHIRVRRAIILISIFPEFAILE